MNTNAYDVHCIFRSIGSTGLVILERDGILLRRKDLLSDLTLGDVDEQFIEMLKRLRDLNLRFGFISDQRGMDAGAYGKSASAALTRVLDELLNLHGAMPDFWMAWGLRQRNETDIRPRDEQPLRPHLGMMRKAMQFYGCDKKTTVFVSRFSGILDANQANIASIQYSGWRGDSEAEVRGHVFPSMTTEVQRLGATIKQFLGLDQRRTA